MRCWLLLVVLLTLQATAELPLGRAGLEEKSHKVILAPGIVYSHVHRGSAISKPAYYVEVKAGLSRPKARELARQLGGEAQPMANRPWWRVCLGPFPTLEAARRGRPASTAVLCSGEDPTHRTGPWEVHVLDIAPSARKVVALSNDSVEGLECVSQLSSRHRASAAVNGGFFVMEAADGTPGDPAGVCVVDGVLVSESVGNRSALVLDNDRPRISRVSGRMILNGSRPIGVNRRLGRVRSAAASPRHDVTFHRKDDVVLFTPHFGSTTPPGSAYEVVVRGHAVERRQGPGPIPKDGFVLAADAAASAYLRKQTRFGLTPKLLENGKPLPLHPRLQIVNGGPLLLHQGRTAVEAQQEGFAWSPTFLETFGLRRHARTLAGITAHGHLLLVVVDGGKPDHSVGLTFTESAELLRALGAVEGMNLDGGGSSTLAIDGKLINQPSDAQGERPVGDAILLYGK